MVKKIDKLNLFKFLSLFISVCLGLKISKYCNKILLAIFYSNTKSETIVMPNFLKLKIAIRLEMIIKGYQ